MSTPSSSSRYRNTPGTARSTSSLSLTRPSQTKTSSSSTALVPVREKTGQFTKSLDRQYVLEEDAYTEALSDIIARDFFPSLARLEATNAYLEAVESMDEEKLEVSVRRLFEVDGGQTPVHGDARSTPMPSYQTSSTPLWTSQTPSQTPYRTPVHHPSSLSSSQRFLAGTTPAAPSSLPTLDNFQANFTSEDNASFTSILQEENGKRKEKYAWAYEPEQKVRLRLEEARDKWVKRLGIEASGHADAVKSQETKLLESGSADGGKRMSIEPKLLDKGKGKELVLSSSSESDPSAMQVTTFARPVGTEEETPLPSADIVLPDDSYLAKALVEAGLPPTAVDQHAVVLREDRAKNLKEKAEKDKRDIGHEGWPFKTRNSLMFAPDVNVSPHEIQKAAVLPSNQAPKAIVHSNTRFSNGLEDDFVGEFSGVNPNEPPSPTRSRIAAAIDGTPYPESESSDSMPTVNGYPLVPTQASPTPSSLGPDRIKQLLTWGTLLSTPRALGALGEAGGATPFRIKDPSRRDDIGRRLASSAGRAISDRAKGLVPASSKGRKRGVGEMNPPSWTSSTPGDKLKKRAGSTVELSPAGRGLLARTRLGSLTPRSGGGSGLGVSGRTSESGGSRSRGERGWSGGKGDGTRAEDISKLAWDASPMTSSRGKGAER
ncbi:Nuclear protein ES2 [Phaffia rhodozyma]|uniref:Nuclear protein ES2 n=1 Tax=Phaffia rhodozyma TaxID=264483 RepID=A0A0F7SMG8_PHARH|nr:Nuclear protein ES2 [Phaffia rhodozyma]